MKIRWEFYSWIPILKRFLPSDICRIVKKGSNVRLDTTLLDFTDRRWQRGNITFLFIGSKKSNDSLIIMDNELKVYQYIRYNESMDIDEDIDLLMSSDLIYPQMITKSISFTRTQAGWFFARSNKTVMANYELTTLIRSYFNIIRRKLEILKLIFTTSMD